LLFSVAAAAAAACAPFLPRYITLRRRRHATVRDATRYLRILLPIAATPLFALSDRRADISDAPRFRRYISILRHAILSAQR